MKKDTTAADQIAISNSISHSRPTVGGLLQPFDTRKIYSTAGMKILQAGLRIEKTDLLSCDEGMILVGLRVICYFIQGCSDKEHLLSAFISFKYTVYAVTSLMDVALPGTICSFAYLYSQIHQLVHLQASLND